MKTKGANPAPTGTPKTVAGAAAAPGAVSPKAKTAPDDSVSVTDLAKPSPASVGAAVAAALGVPVADAKSGSDSAEDSPKSVTTVGASLDIGSKESTQGGKINTAGKLNISAGGKTNNLGSSEVNAGGGTTIRDGGQQ